MAHDKTSGGKGRKNFEGASKSEVIQSGEIGERGIRRKGVFRKMEERAIHALKSQNETRTDSQLPKKRGPRFIVTVMEKRESAWIRNLFYKTLKEQGRGG